MTKKTKESAVSFSGDARIHIGLAAANLRKSIAFYEILFGQPPSKTRPGYAKFEVERPAVHLSLIEHNKPTSLRRPAHFGVQVKSSNRVAELAERLTLANLPIRTEENEICCHAIQDKVWTADPDGNWWEVFVILDNDPEEANNTSASTNSASACCDSDCCTETEPSTCEMQS